MRSLLAYHLWHLLTCSDSGSHRVHRQQLASYALKPKCVSCHHLYTTPLFQLVRVFFFKSNKKFFRRKHFSPQFIQHRLWDYEQSVALCMAAGSTTLRAIRRALSDLLGSQNDELHDEWESKDTDWTCRRIPVPPPPPLPPVSCPTKLMTCLKVNTWEL